MKFIVEQLKTAFILLCVLTLMTGFVYPWVVTGLAQCFFKKQADGSLIQVGSEIIGSALIGQSFTDEKYFWGRFSATPDFPFNALDSTGSNSGPSNPNFLNIVKQRIAYLRQADLQNIALVPVDLVTTSASGLDPEISPKAAFYQIHRIAKARHVSEQLINTLIWQSIQGRFLGVIGEPRVNILLLNLALDKQTSVE